MNFLQLKKEGNREGKNILNEERRDGEMKESMWDRQKKEIREIKEKLWGRRERKCYFKKGRVEERQKRIKERNEAKKERKDV